MGGERTGQGLADGRRDAHPRQEKRLIENMINDLKYPQEWQLKESLGFIHVSPRMGLGSHRKTNRTVISDAAGYWNERWLSTVSALSQGESPVTSRVLSEWAGCLDDLLALLVWTFSSVILPLKSQ